MERTLSQKDEKNSSRVVVKGRGRVDWCSVISVKVAEFTTKVEDKATKKRKRRCLQKSENLQRKGKGKNIDYHRRNKLANDGKGRLFLSCSDGANGERQKGGNKGWRVAFADETKIIPGRNTNQTA